MTKIELDLAELLGQNPEGPDMMSYVLDQAARLVADKMRLHIETRAQTIVDNIINAEVRTIVQQALAAPIQTTSPWGEKKGEPTTVLELARTALERFLKQPASYHNNGRHDGANNLTELVDDVVKKAMRDELAPVIKEARQLVSAQLTQRLLDSVTIEATKVR